MIGDSVIKDALVDAIDMKMQARRVVFAWLDWQEGRTMDDWRNLERELRTLGRLAAVPLPTERGKPWDNRDAPRGAGEARVDGGSATHTPHQEPVCNNAAPPPRPLTTAGENV